MSLHTQLLRGLLALPAAVLIAIAGLVAPPASALPPCDDDAAVSLPQVEVAAGEARVLVVREVAKR